MMGWVSLAALAAMAAGALMLLRIPRLLWSISGAALMLGAAGYAVQGNPALSVQPAQPSRDFRDAGEVLVDLRTDMFGRYGADSAYLTAADALSRGGSHRYEVEAILGGIRAAPRSVQLWTALGDALARHDADQLSPAARFAFDQARRLDPRHPGPLFFLGMAQLRSENFAGARDSWRKALVRTAASAPYRGEIAERLAVLDQLLAMR